MSDLQPPANGKLTAAAPNQASVSTRFQPGNQAALKHGRYAMKPVAILPSDVQGEIDAFRGAVLADLGNVDLTAIESGYVQRLVEVETAVRLSTLNILRNGFTAKSSQMFLQAVDRWDRIASRLGMKRRAKAIKDMSVDEYLEGQRAQRPAAPAEERDE